MIQVKLMLLGLSVLVGAGIAIYTYYQSKEEPQQHRRSDQRSDRSCHEPYNNNSIARLRIKQSRDEKNVCSICLDDMTNLFTTLKCGHKFHGICIKDWFSASTSCPLCRDVNK